MFSRALPALDPQAQAGQTIGYHEAVTHPAGPVVFRLEAGGVEEAERRFQS